MGLIVQKFGGSSVADAERVMNVARIVTDTYKQGNDVIVVVSAQGDTTDDLIEKAMEINPNANKREMDQLLTAGEQISISLLAMAIEKLFFNTNAKTAIDVAQARGVILLGAKESGLGIFEYTPLQVKQSVVGYGRAEKKQVQEMTRIMLGLEKVPKPDDTADALAMAICHAHSSCSSLGMLKYR